MSFLKLKDVPGRLAMGGAITGHYAHLLNSMTIGEVVANADTELPIHSHPHDQVTYVLEGRLRFTLGDETRELSPGMTILIPGGVKHGGHTITPIRLLDIFTPVREDFRG